MTEFFDEVLMPLCQVCAERHQVYQGDCDPGCDWDKFPGFGWRDAMHSHGWILHEDNQTGDAVWLRPKNIIHPRWGWEQCDPKDSSNIVMTWTIEEYEWLFTRVTPEYQP